ncbi:hypothetical protein [Paenibacillus tyrfis]|uniref:Uncharacterized protein n=1 Tax=Paenibacillus tyrfis TaxID=1501230 RepID=A0A081NWR7_9BACL|nr:hypothetical protein [Paenibacillus tyrfis]KEQ22890.1 hypothetical protein ET33_21345 [Paenibacillus tyrfis]
MSKQKVIINAAAGGVSFTVFWMVVHYFTDKDVSIGPGLIGGVCWFLGALIISSFKKNNYH